MLVLERSPGSKVVVTVDDVRVEIVYIGMRGGNARLGFDAPTRVDIFRGEIQELIDREDAEKARNVR